MIVTMEIQVITITKGRYAIFDCAAAKFIVDNASALDAAEALLNYVKPSVIDWISKEHQQMSYLEARIRAGLIQCCRCTTVVTLEQYNPKLAENKQWCKDCYSKL